MLEDPSTAKMTVVLETGSVETRSEELIFDIVSIVASVGGSLGLFLGFSCLNVSKMIMDWFNLK